jgi:hypothetical protein
MRCPLCQAARAKQFLFNLLSLLDICDVLSKKVFLFNLQSSSEIYDVALKKVQTFVSGRILETKIAGRIAASLCRCLVKIRCRCRVFLKQKKIFLLYIFCSLRCRNAPGRNPTTVKMERENERNQKILGLLPSPENLLKIS